MKKFWEQADFGYVDERRKELTMLCEPQSPVSLLGLCCPSNLLLEYSASSVASTRVLA